MHARQSLCPQISVGCACHQRPIFRLNFEEEATIQVFVDVKDLSSLIWGVLRSQRLQYEDEVLLHTTLPQALLCAGMQSRQTQSTGPQRAYRCSKGTGGN